MPDTSPNLKIQANVWIDIYSSTGIPVGEPISIQNTGTCDLYLTISPTEPSSDSNSYNILKRGACEFFANSQGDSGAWVKCPNQDGELNVSVSGSGGFKPLNPPIDFFFEVASGNVPGKEIVIVFSENPSVGIGEPSDIWTVGGKLVYPTANEQWRIVSTSTDDALAGNGAQRVVVEYLDSDFIEQSVDVELNGTNPVNLPFANGFRFLSMAVTQAGSALANVGDLTLGSVATVPRARILAGKNNVRGSHYTVPSGKRAFLLYFHTTVSKNKDADYELLSTTGPDGLFKSTVPMKNYQTTHSYTPIGFSNPIVEGTDIKVTGTTENNNTPMQTVYQLLLEDVA